MSHDTMKQILLVLTGGTIGSTATAGTIKPSSSAPFKLLQLFEQNYADHQALHFDTLQPIQILSENLAPAAWEIIIAAIESAQPDKYDGIIVTHGTDTLAYTAAALSFYFHANTIPILLVSSDYPLDNPKGNGLANFICAVEFIRQRIAAGVFVPYRNAGQTLQIHRGTRLACSLQLSGDFYNVQGKNFMQFDGQYFSSATAPINQSGNADQQNNESAASTDIIPLKPQFSSHILMIKPYPGLDYSHFDLKSVDVVLHDLYHSGTACATEQWGKNHSLLEQGAEIIWNTSIEAAYVKLMLAYGNFSDKLQIHGFLNKTIAFEHIQKPQ
jgi:L-asparaginase/Glu-tRNA(Gln) amidotransferase subunit D